MSPIKSSLHNESYFKSNLHNESFLKFSLHNESYLKSSLHKESYIKFSLHNESYIKSSLYNESYLKSSLHNESYLKCSLHNESYHMSTLDTVISWVHLGYLVESQGHRSQAHLVLWVESALYPPWMMSHISGPPWITSQISSPFCIMSCSSCQPWTMSCISSSLSISSCSSCPSFCCCFLVIILFIWTYYFVSAEALVFQPLRRSHFDLCIGVECAVLCAAHPTQKQYKWRAVPFIMTRISHISFISRPDAVAEPVECRLPMWKIRSSQSSHTEDLHLTLLSLALGINEVGQELASLVSV